MKCLPLVLVLILCTIVYADKYTIRENKWQALATDHNSFSKCKLIIFNTLIKRM